jgi:uncharacterized membrane protein HdeD (DUF308 family)
MKPKLLSKLKSPRWYARIVGSLLFILGLVGFAFANATSLSDSYLFLALLLGFWGVVISFNA